MGRGSKFGSWEGNLGLPMGSRNVTVRAVTAVLAARGNQGSEMDSKHMKHWYDETWAV